MKTISKNSFLRQFSSHGIALDSRYSPPQTLVFESKSDWRWSWEMPSQIKNVPRWITSLIDATHSEKKIYLYPRAGAWTSGDSLKLFQMSTILAAYSLKPRGDEVIEAEASERDAVESLFFLALLHGGTVSDDIFLIPDNAKVILYADHHESVNANFGEGEFMNRFLPEIPEY
jgi:hypothetical protein